MRIEYDSEVDAAYIYLVEEVRDGEAVIQRNVNVFSDAEMILDLDQRGLLLGIEIIGASHVLRSSLLQD
jgi:uncharacterized protein YuzE